MIGTGLAIAFALGSAGATAASNVYGAKKTAETNDKSIAAQRDADTAANKLEQDRLATQAAQADKDRADAEKAHADAVALDREHWANYVNANTPTWQAGQKTLGTLFDMAHLGAPPSSAMSMPNASAPPPAGTPVAGAGGAPSSASLYDLATRNAAPAATSTGGAPATTTQPAAQVQSLGRTIASQYPRMNAPTGSSAMSLLDLMKMAQMVGSGPSAPTR